MSTLTTASERSLASNKELRRQARQLFFAGIYVTEIMEGLQLADQAELMRYVMGEDGRGIDPQCWMYQRSQRPRSSAVTYERVKPFLLKSVEFKFLNRVRASIDAMEEKDELLAMADMERAVGIVERLDKITRLEEGKATEHIATTRTSYSLRDLARMKEQQNGKSPPTDIEAEVAGPPRSPPPTLPDPSEA